MLAATVVGMLCPGRTVARVLSFLSRLPAPADRQQPPGPSRFGRALQRHGVCGALLPLRFCKRLKRALHPHGLPFAVPLRRRIYCPLTTLAHHRRMKSRHNMADVIEGLRKEHGLLAAFLEAAGKLDCRAFNRRVAMAKPVNVEAHQASAAPVLSQGAPLIPAPSPLILRRANLARVSE